MQNVIFKILKQLPACHGSYLADTGGSFIYILSRTTLAMASFKSYQSNEAILPAHKSSYLRIYKSLSASATDLRLSVVSVSIFEMEKEILTPLALKEYYANVLVLDIKERLTR